MGNLLKNNDMAKVVNMTPSAFAKGVREGRFSVSEKNPDGENLFDPAVIIQEHKDTVAVAKLQNHALLMPEGFQGGRPTGVANTIVDTEQYLKMKITQIAFNAKLLEQKYKVRSGELIEKITVERQGAELGAVMLGAIETWAKTITQAVDVKDKHNFQMALEKECNNLINQIKNECCKEYYFEIFENVYKILKSEKEREFLELLNSLKGSQG